MTSFIIGTRYPKLLLSLALLAVLFPQESGAFVLPKQSQTTSAVTLSASFSSSNGKSFLQDLGSKLKNSNFGRGSSSTRSDTKPSYSYSTNSRNSYNNNNNGNSYNSNSNTNNIEKQLDRQIRALEQEAEREMKKAERIQRNIERLPQDKGVKKLNQPVVQPPTPSMSTSTSGAGGSFMTNGRGQINSQSSVMTATEALRILQEFQRQEKDCDVRIGGNTNMAQLAARDQTLMTEIERLREMEVDFRRTHSDKEAQRREIDEYKRNLGQAQYQEELAFHRVQELERQLAQARSTLENAQRNTISKQQDYNMISNKYVNNDRGLDQTRYGIEETQRWLLDQLRMRQSETLRTQASLMEQERFSAEQKAMDLRRQIEQLRAQQQGGYYANTNNYGSTTGAMSTAVPRGNTGTGYQSQSYQRQQSAFQQQQPRQQLGQPSTSSTYPQTSYSPTPSYQVPQQQQYARRNPGYGTAAEPEVVLGANPNARMRTG